MNDNIPPGFDTEGTPIRFPKMSEARKVQWRKISPEERSKIMSQMATKHQQLLTPEQRKENATRASHARKMKKAV